MKKIAITGGLSSGKSSVCKILKAKGAYVVSADEIVHKLLSPQSLIGKRIIELLGEEIVVEGQFNRALISKKIFNNKELLQAIEKIIHPAVLEEIERQFVKASLQKEYKVFIAEIPLLYEIKAACYFDTVVVVQADPILAKSRFQAKHKDWEDEFEKRMENQLPLKEKEEKADFIINNNGSFAELTTQVEKLLKDLD